jgi:hypothetical protein
MKRLYHKADRTVNNPTTSLLLTTIKHSEYPTKNSTFLCVLVSKLCENFILSINNLVFITLFKPVRRSQYSKRTHLSLSISVSLCVCLSLWFVSLYVFLCVFFSFFFSFVWVCVIDVMCSCVFIFLLLSFFFFLFLVIFFLFFCH